MIFNSCHSATTNIDGRSKSSRFGVCNFKRCHRFNSDSQNLTHITNPRIQGYFTICTPVHVISNTMVVTPAAEFLPSKTNA